MFMERGSIVPLAAEIKKHVDVPVACIGALNDPAQMEEIIASGKADVVEMARALLADPYLPRKVVLGRDEEILKCIRCYTCLAERVHTQTRICAINPVIGREFESRFAYPATRPKKVLVVGGGPGGMQTAITAAERGHAVILCEKKGVLGGALNFAAAIPFKRDLFALIDTFAIRMQKAGVEVRLNTEATNALVEAEAPDVLVMAVGATPVMPAIPGLAGAAVIKANDLADEQSRIGKRVVILGGGLVGCETAVHLAQLGKTATVVEMMSAVAEEANVRQRPILLDMMQRCNVRVETGLRGVEAKANGLLCVDDEGVETFIEADTVICAVGQRPLREVVNRFLDAAPEVVQVGDCVQAKSVTQAIRRGYWAGMDI
jgi:NADPH-dependent 2,4-dienoyl-CoA reductase/sulfur reductase-like enzyme